jgi:uncharacterized protein YecE (DUF72 family)
VSSITEPRIRIGPAGWSYADWSGIVYPERKPRSFDDLAFLASYFDLIEVNSTFYRTPSRATCRRWVERTLFNRDFAFTAKAPREVTHRPQPAVEADIGGFKKAVEPLWESERLGAILVQFPWSFRASPESMAYITRLSGWLAPFPAVIEVRHGSWDAPRPRAFFRSAGMARCGIDQPALGDSIGPGKGLPTSERAYLRLHGRNREKWFDRDAGRDERYNYLYGQDELSYWRDVIREAGASTRNTYVVLNNHFRGQAVVNALQLRAMLSGQPAPAPRHLLDAYPSARDQLRAGPAWAPSLGRNAEGQFELFGEEPDHDGDGPDHDE